MRSVVIDALSGRQLIAGPEERDATQPLIFYLTQRLGWHPEQIISRPQWRVPRTPSADRSRGFPVDLAIFASPTRRGDPDAIRIIAECKAPDIESGTGQLKILLGLEPEARLGIWFNGNRHCLVYKTPSGFIVNEVAPIPRPTDPLAPCERVVPLRHADLLEPPNLGEIFSTVRDRIAAQDTHINRDEFILNDLANLLICKIADEQQGESDPQRTLAFQLAGGAETTGHAIRQFFEDVKRRLPSVFTDETERLHVDDASIDDVVRRLERYRLLGIDRHAVGKAFQILRGRALKGQEGAYFTPPALVDCVVQVLGPDDTNRTIDPACGTGGFLAAALDYVFETVDARPGLSVDAKDGAKRRWAQEQLFAVDKDAVSTKLCKAYLTLLGDGRSHVYRANTIDRSEWAGRSDDLTRAVSGGGFDLVLTNPPFGKNLVVSPEVGHQEKLKTSTKWQFVAGSWQPTEKPVEQQLGISFFERGLALLNDDRGRMAIVLPETFLFSKSFQWFVNWICRTVTVTHVVDVPMVAFEEFCRAKTCLVFIRKAAPTPGHQITMSYPRSIGQDKRGNPLYQIGEHGTRSGELDNEIAAATKEIVGREYRGTARDVPIAGDSRLCFRVLQETVRDRGVLVPRFWWRRDSQQALDEWAARKPSVIVTLGELADRGIIRTFEGHGSPPGHTRATGSVPYVKVSDLKNWRINENPTNFIHRAVADKLRGRGPILQFGDLITPSRASSNIGQFAFVLPWQTDIVLTKEVLIIRTQPNDEGISPFLLLALMSLRVVQDQYQTLALMQTNREHLGDHWREVQIPLPASSSERIEMGNAVQTYFDGIVRARESWTRLSSMIEPDYFGTRP
jgi:type I restriction enzyme M protein